MRAIAGYARTTAELSLQAFFVVSRKTIRLDEDVRGLRD